MKSSATEINQKSYIERVLAQFGMQEPNSAKTPMEFGKTSKERKNGEETAYPFPDKAELYVRRDLNEARHQKPAVFRVARFTQKPTSEHVVTARRIFRYLNGTTGTGLTLGGSVGRDWTRFVDADWEMTPRHEVDDRIHLPCKTTR